MKMKSFAVLAISGLLAASAFYVAPAIAADDITSGPMKNDVGNTPNNNPQPNIAGIDQTDSMNIASNDNNTNDMGMGSTDNNSNNDAANNGGDNSGNNNSVTNAPSANSPNSSDEGAPDTATGDDDY